MADERRVLKIPREEYELAEQLTGKSDPVEIWRSLVQGFQQSKEQKWIQPVQPTTNPAFVLKLRETQEIDHWRSVRLESQARLARAKAITAELSVSNLMAKDETRQQLADMRDNYLKVRESIQVYCSECRTEHLAGPCPTKQLPENIQR